MVTPHAFEGTRAMSNDSTESAAGTGGTGGTDSTRTGIAPWLAVSDGQAAVDFYRAAFGAVELYRLDGEDGRPVVAQLAVDGAAFWIQDDPENSPTASMPHGSGGPVRMILTVADPDRLFGQAVAAGATTIAEVHEDHGWRVGRVADPSGHHWEISRQTGSDA